MKTVSGICKQFTQQLEQVRTKQIKLKNEAANRESTAKADRLAAEQEVASADVAIDNIKTLFGQAS